MNLRTIDRLISAQGVSEQYRDLLESVAKHAPVYVADEVARYFFEEMRQESWNLGDFMGLFPAADVMFFDFKAPKFINLPDREKLLKFDPRLLQWGFLVTTTCRGDSTDRGFHKQLHHLPTAHRDQVHWILNCLFFPCLDDEPQGPDIMWTFYVREDGTPALDESGESFLSLVPFSLLEEHGSVADIPKASIQAAAEASDELKGVWTCLLMTLAFLGCSRGLTLNGYVPSRVVAKRQRRMKRRPLTHYKVIKVEGIRQLLIDEGGAGRVGYKTALKLCRLHFGTPQTSLWEGEVPRFAEVLDHPLTHVGIHGCCIKDVREVAGGVSAPTLVKGED